MIEFKKTIEFPKGTFYKQLVDAYSFNDNCKRLGMICGMNMMNSFIQI